MKGFMIAAPQSRSGKTVVTLGILRALKNRGAQIATAKSGPDFIDPAFHTAASGSECVNLDAWAMRPELIGALAGRAVSGGKLLIAEAAMGLFDGAATGEGSAADLAASLSLPVILVIDCARQSQSVAALVRGFRDHRNDVLVAGLVLNKVGSVRHDKMLRAALEPLGDPVIGSIMREKQLQLPERHLGLVQAEEHQELETFIAAAGDAMEVHLDIGELLAIALQAPDSDLAAGVSRIDPLGQRVAVARDEAFAFAYPHLLNGWQRRGAEISFFSPLADETPGEDCDAIYLPGGYPELHGGRIAAAEKCREALRKASDTGKVIYGECGGYMVMGEAMTDEEGMSHRMFGLLPLETSFAQKKRQLGYRQIAALGDGPLRGRFRGHEFHFASIVKEGKADRLFAIQDAADNDLGDAGLRRGKVCGSFMHLIDRVDD